MKTQHSNNKLNSSGKLHIRGFSPVPVLLLAVLLTGLTLISGACATGATTATMSGTTPVATSGTTGPTTETSTTTTSAGTTKSQDNEEPASVQLIGADEALQILKDNPDAILLDVRTEQEFVSGHITGAVLIPVDEIP
jgi:hypothetical protein